MRPSRCRSGMKAGALYAYPREKSIRRFMDQVRARTRRCTPLQTTELIAELNPLCGGGGIITSEPHVRKLLHRLRRLDSGDASGRIAPGVRQGLERIALGAAIRRVRTGQLDSVNPVPCLSVELSLCESCMRENRTCSLSGGRWPQRVSAPPPTRQRRSGVMPVERRGQVTGVGVDRSTGNGRNRLGLTEGGSLHAVARAG